MGNKIAVQLRRHALKPSRPLADITKKTGMLRAGERVGVGVSGGADSVALLMLLLELREELGIVVSVAHLNHKLRGKASDADEKFVRRAGGEAWAGVSRGERGRGGAGSSAKRRIWRMRVDGRGMSFSRRLVAEGKVDRVAVAHTADDQAETVLAHILRGTGLAGLGGIHPQTKSVVQALAWRAAGGVARVFASEETEMARGRYESRYGANAGADSEEVVAAFGETISEWRGGASWFAGGVCAGG